MTYEIPAKSEDDYKVIGLSKEKRLMVKRRSILLYLQYSLQFKCHYMCILSFLVFLINIKLNLFLYTAFILMLCATLSLFSTRFLL